MNTKLLRRLALLTVIAAPFAGVSAASLIDYGASSQADVSASLGAAAHATSSKTGLTGSGSVNVSANAQNNATTSQNGGTPNRSASGEEHSSATVTTGANGSVDVSAGNSGNTIHIDRASIATSTGIIMMKTPGEVQTSDDLKAFATASLENDPNLSAMDFASDHLMVTYREPGRFLGFIPMNMDVAVTVNGDGTVVTSYPWYSFLVMSQKADLDASVSSEVSASYQPSSGLTPAVEANLAARIQAIMRSHLTTDSGTATTTQTQNSNS